MSVSSPSSCSMDSSGKNVSGRNWFSGTKRSWFGLLFCRPFSSVWPPAFCFPSENISTWPVWYLKRKKTSLSRCDWTGRRFWTIISRCNKLVRGNCRWFCSVKRHETTHFPREWHLHGNSVGGTGARCQCPGVGERVGRLQSHPQQVGGGEFSISQQSIGHTHAHIQWWLQSHENHTVDTKLWFNQSYKRIMSLTLVSPYFSGI